MSTDPVRRLLDPEAVGALDTIDAAHLPALATALAAWQARLAARLGREAVTLTVTPPASDDGRLLRIDDVATILGVPKQHAYELARRELPAVRFGKYVRVRAADLDAWIARHRDSP